jgi:hypothetical protein
MLSSCDQIATLPFGQPHCRCEGVRNDVSTNGSACALLAIALRRTLSGDFVSWSLVGRELEGNRGGQDKSKRGLLQRLARESLSAHWVRTGCRQVFSSSGNVRLGRYLRPTL